MVDEHFNTSLQEENIKKSLQVKYEKTINDIERLLILNNNSIDDMQYFVPAGLLIITKSSIANFLPLKADKDGLFNWRDLKKTSSNPRLAGYFDVFNFYLLANQYFRRGYSLYNNYAPHFIEEFYKLDKKNLDAYLSVDENVIKIDEPSLYCEFDRWFGAPFNKNISLISDGIVKLKPPDIFDGNSMLFNNNYSLDVKWSTKDNIKTFQLLEFKDESVKVYENGNTIYPVRYIHAEFDLNRKIFKHFDGAIHFYEENHYFEKRDKDINFDLKSFSGSKPTSKKLFKINGEIAVDDWSNLTTHFLHGNPLIYEYFTGEYPQYIKRILDLD